MGRLFRLYSELLGRPGGFRPLFLATLVSGLGTMLAVTALTVDVYERTGSGVWVSALLIADFVPTIAIGLLFGPLIDRLSRRRLMIWADLVRLGAFAALPFAPNAHTIVALALVVGFANGFFGPAALAALPNFVDEDELSHANGLFQATQNLTWMLGPFLGGALLAVSGPDLPYAVNAVTFLLSAALILRIPAGRFAGAISVARGHWRELRAGFAVLRRSRPVLTVAVSWSVAMLASAAVNVGEVFLVREAFGAGNFELGVMMGTSGAGLVAGSLVAGSILDRRAMALVYGGSLALMGVGYGLAALSPLVWLALPCVLLAGFGNGVAAVCNPLLIQRGVDDAHRGRAFTVVMSVNFVFLGLGMAIAGPLNDGIGPRWLWAGAAAASFAAAALGAVLARGVATGAPAGASTLVVAAAGSLGVDDRGVAADRTERAL